jgi:hypothetical protein
MWVYRQGDVNFVSILIEYCKENVKKYNTCI